MKYFVALLVLATVSAVFGQGPPGHNGHDRYREDWDACIATNPGAPESEIQILRKHGVPTDPIAKNILACMQKKIGLLTSDNKFNDAKMREMLERMPDGPEKTSRLAGIQYCKDNETPAANAGEAAVNILNCLIKQAEKNGYNFFPERRHVHPTP